MDKAERADRTARLAAAATALPPEQWLADQLDALRLSSAQPAAELVGDRQAARSSDARRPVRRRRCPRRRRPRAPPGSRRRPPTPGVPPARSARTAANAGRSPRSSPANSTADGVPTLGGQRRSADALVGARRAQLEHEPSGLDHAGRAGARARCERAAERGQRRRRVGGRAHVHGRTTPPLSSIQAPHRGRRRRALTRASPGSSSRALATAADGVRALHRPGLPALRAVQTEDHQPGHPLQPGQTPTTSAAGRPVSDGEPSQPRGQGGQRLDGARRRHGQRPGRADDRGERPVVVARDQRARPGCGEQRRERASGRPVGLHPLSSAGRWCRTTVSGSLSIPGTAGRIRLTPRSYASRRAAASWPGG